MEGGTGPRLPLRVEACKGSKFHQGENASKDDGMAGAVISAPAYMAWCNAVMHCTEYMALRRGMQAGLAGWQAGIAAGWQCRLILPLPSAIIPVIGLHPAHPIVHGSP